MNIEKEHTASLYHFRLRQEILKHEETRQQSEQRLKQIQHLLVDQANLKRSYNLLEEHFAVLLAHLKEQ